MKKSFIRLTGFGIVIALMIFVATRNGSTQEAGKQPPSRQCQRTTGQRGATEFIEFQLNPKDHGGFLDARAHQRHGPEIPSGIANGTG